MSRQDANAAFALSSFLHGTNATYIDEIYARYEKDPSSVDAEWQEFFKSLNDHAADVQKNAEGPSWERANWPLTPQDDLTSALDGNWAAGREAVGAKIAAKAQAKRRQGAVSAADVLQATRDSVRALMLIRAYRMRGHFHAKLDPLGIEAAAQPRRARPAHLRLHRSRFRPQDLPRPRARARIRARCARSSRSASAPTARRSASSSCTSPTPRRRPGSRSASRGRTRRSRFTREGRRAILKKLVEAEGFEKFCDAKFTGTKRFGLDGGESLIPALEQIIKRGGNLGVKEIVLGMPHRGRLNVLTQVMGKPHRALFHEFKGGSANPDAVEGSGDVKYHLGASSDREFDGNRSICR